MTNRNAVRSIIAYHDEGVTKVLRKNRRKTAINGENTNDNAKIALRNYFNRKHRGNEGE